MITGSNAAGEQAQAPAVYLHVGSEWQQYAQLPTTKMCPDLSRSEGAPDWVVEKFSESTC